MDFGYNYHTEWGEIERLAGVRGRGKEGYASTRRLVAEYDVIGVCAERLFEVYTGLPMDRTYRASGDTGIDFVDAEGRTYDVKGTAHHNVQRYGSKCFLLHGLEPVRAHCLGLVDVYVAHRCAWWLGWMLGQEFEERAQRVVLREEKGEQRYVTADMLTPGFPPWLPLRVVFRGFPAFDIRWSECAIWKDPAKWDLNLKAAMQCIGLWTQADLMRVHRGDR